jgi:hypothetical protein
MKLHLNVKKRKRKKKKKRKKKENIKASVTEPREQFWTSRIKK